VLALLTVKTHSLIAQLVLATGLLSCNVTTTSATDCQRFHQGQFTYHVLGPDGRVDILITRNDSIQTERYQQTGDVSRLAIRWTSPCSYDLRLLTSTLKFSPAVEASRRRDALHTEILSSTARYCVFRTRRDNVDFVMTDTLWIKN